MKSRQTAIERSNLGEEIEKLVQNYAQQKEIPSLSTMLLTAHIQLVLINSPAVTPELRSKFETIGKRTANLPPDTQEPIADVTPPSTHEYEPFTAKFTYEQLKSRIAQNCDPSNLEVRYPLYFPKIFVLLTSATEVSNRRRVRSSIQDDTS